MFRLFSVTQHSQLALRCGGHHNCHGVVDCGSDFSSYDPWQDVGGENPNTSESFLDL